MPAVVVKRKSVPGADIKRVKDDFLREWHKQAIGHLQSAVARVFARMYPSIGDPYHRYPYRWPRGRAVVYSRVRIPDLVPPPFGGARPRVVFGEGHLLGTLPEQKRGPYSATVESVTWGGRHRYPSANVRVRRG